MSRIRTPWTPPSVDDTANEHVLGFDWSADIAVTANGLWWLETGLNRPSTVRAMMWLTSGPTLVADSGTVSATGYTLDTWNFIPFTSAFNASAGTTYTIGVYFTGAYKFSSTDLSSDQVDASGHVRALAHTGRFLNAGGANFPTSTWDGMFGTDLDFTLSSPSSTPSSLVVTQPAKAVGGKPILLRSSLVDSPVLTTKPPLLVTGPARPSPPNQAIVWRNTLVDPPVLTTPAPLVVTRPATPSRPNQAYLSRSSLVDVVIVATGTPGPLVVTQPAKPVQSNQAYQSRNSLVDVVVPASSPPEPLVVTSPARVLTSPPVILRGTLADPLVLTTPLPLVVTRPTAPVLGFAAVWRSSFIDAPPLVNAASSPTVTGLAVSAITAAVAGSGPTVSGLTSTPSATTNQSSATATPAASLIPTVSDG